MNFLCGPQTLDSCSTLNFEWLQFFNVVITGSAKQNFFHDENHANLFEVEPASRMLLNTDNGTPMPQVVGVALRLPLKFLNKSCKEFQEASAAISGADVYGKLKFESGIHRVQFCDEKSGHVHTKSLSVAILPQHEDLRIDTYRSGGSWITHIPSGITVSIQDERSQHMNKAKALKVLCARLYEMERSRIQTSRSKLRSEQIGSRDRPERIRTYNFPQGRVTDHRVGIAHYSEIS
ncbi:Peptide chain release factor 1 [Camellia lanceoleosa]|uniref:Peptide chain release factor 1 n=1 Tax=Camellia lanceoleosa TaxID=1840588 RepID=A0ACC0GAT0_9ERIC|nr:Peptide chain release factor 1 [Camellia lanceoleosa]